MESQNYIYVVLCDNTVSSLGFSTFEKAEQWLYKERNRKRINNEWLFSDGNIHYKVKEIKII